MKLEYVEFVNSVTVGTNEKTFVRVGDAPGLRIQDGLCWYSETEFSPMWNIRRGKLLVEERKK